MKTPRVLIVVEGGLVQNVVSDAPVEYLIKDFDSTKEDPEYEFDGSFQPADLVCPTEEAFMREVMADAE